ncbi:MAG: YIP1 family protein [Acidobacteriota bacterium]
MSQDPSAGPPPPPPYNPYAPPSAPVGGGGGGGGVYDGGGKPPLPWDERSRLGLVDALISTIKLFVTDPREAYSRLRSDGDYVGPMLFGGIIAWVMAIIGQIWSLLFSGVFGGIAGLGGDVEGLGMLMGGGIAQLLLMAVLMPFIYVIGVFISAGLYHLGLMIVGGLQNSQAGFEGTFRIVSYSYVGQLAQIVPILGTIVALIWQIVLIVFGHQEHHGVPQGKAVLAALLPLVLCCLCVAVLVIGAGMMGAGLAGLAGAGG